MADEALSDAKKEQITLRATFLNNIGIGVILVGVLTPLIRAVYEPSILVAASFGTLAVSALICFLLGVALHLAGNWILRGLSK